VGDWTAEAAGGKASTAHPEGVGVRLLKERKGVKFLTEGDETHERRGGKTRTGLIRTTKITDLKREEHSINQRS